MGEPDAAAAVASLLADPKVRKTVAWWRRKRAWGLDWLEQEAVVNRAVHRTAQKHQPGRQQQNSSFTRFLIWETDRALAARRSRGRGAEPGGDDRDLDALPAPAREDRDPDGRAERLWRWAERYLSTAELAVVRAVYGDGLTHEAAAAALGLTRDAVAGRLRAAVGRLRALAEDEGWTPDPDSPR